MATQINQEELHEVILEINSFPFLDCNVRQFGPS
jgi:hypothetical protein